MTAPLPFDRIHLFELLKPKLGAEESKAIVDALDGISAGIKENVAVHSEEAKKDLATKGDILAIKSDILAMREDIHRLEVKMLEKFNSQLIWLIGTIFAATGLALTIAKIF